MLTTPEHRAKAIESTAAERILGRVARERSERKTIQATEEEQGTKIVKSNTQGTCRHGQLQQTSTLTPEKKQHRRPPDKLLSTHIGRRDKSQQTPDKNVQKQALPRAKHMPPNICGLQSNM